MANQLTSFPPPSLPLPLPLLSPASFAFALAFTEGTLAFTEGTEVRGCRGRHRPR